MRDPTGIAVAVRDLARARRATRERQAASPARRRDRWSRLQRGAEAWHEPWLRASAIAVCLNARGPVFETVARPTCRTAISLGPTMLSRIERFRSPERSRPVR